VWVGICDVLSFVSEGIIVFRSFDIENFGSNSFILWWGAEQEEGSVWRNGGKDLGRTRISCIIQVHSIFNTSFSQCGKRLITVSHTCFLLICED